MAADKWQDVRLGDLVNEGVLAISDGYRVRNEELGSEGIPFVRGGDIGDGWINTSTDDHIRPEYSDRVRTKITQPGDVAFITKGTVGRAGQLREGQPPVVFAPQVAFWRVLDSNMLDSRFIFYLVRSHAFQSALYGVMSHGSMVADYVSISQQHEFRIKIPDIKSQRAIAYTLGTLDDKIELNRRKNESLEAMARALFKSWFVDFDPVRANADGRESRLPKPIADLFPNSFEDSELGEIPEGWQVARLGDSDFFPLVTPGVSGDATAPVHYIATGDVQRDHISSDTQGVLASLPSRANMQPGDGRVWFAKMKDSPKYLWTMTEDQEWWSDRVLSTGFAGLQATSTAYEAMLYCFIAGPQFDRTKNNLATGTTMQALNNDTISTISLVVPPPSVAVQFDYLARPLFRRRWSNAFEVYTLAKLRDTLLPKLISGELRIENAERFIGESA